MVRHTSLFSQLDHDGYLPTYAYIYNGKKHDIPIARKIPLSPYSIVAMNTGYSDYCLFAHWTEDRTFFVTWLKDNADYTIVKERSVPRNRNIIADQLIQFSGQNDRKRCPPILRKMTV